MLFDDIFSGRKSVETGYICMGLEVCKKLDENKFEHGSYTSPKTIM